MVRVYTPRMRPPIVSAAASAVLCLLAGLALVSCATTRGSTLRTVVNTETVQPRNPTRPSMPPASAPQTATTEKKGIEVDTDPDSAEVWMDGIFRGLSPYIITDATQGWHQIVVKKGGYYDSSAWVQLTSDYMLYQTNLVQIIGFLNVEITPADASITLDGLTISSGLVQVPVGTYSLRVRRFGYDDYEATVQISESAVTTSVVTLPAAEFAVTNFSVPKKGINPDNPGLLGTLDGYYSVTAPGSGLLTVADATGTTVYSHDLPDFTSWDNSFSWDVVDDAGTKLADGQYTVSMVARGMTGGASVTRSVGITVDRTLKIAARSLWSGSSGLLYAPVPEVLPPGDFQIEVMGAGIALADFSVFQAPVMLGTRIGMDGKLELDASLGIIAVPTSLPVLASVAARWNLAAPQGEYGTSAAIQAKISGQFIPATAVPLMTDTFANFSGVSLEIPLQISLGPLGILLTPGVTASLWYPYRFNADATPEQSFAAWVYLRGGVMFDFGSFTAGISASTRTEALPDGMAFLGTPVPFEVGAEAHWLIPDTRLLLSGILAGEYEDQDNYYLMGGFGLGFLY